MGPPVTPSPTPPADGRPGLSPSPQATRKMPNGYPAPGMGPSDIGPWRYTTPPFEERPLYSHTQRMSPAMTHLSIPAENNARRSLSSSSPPTVSTQLWDEHGQYIPALGVMNSAPRHSTRHRSPSKAAPLASKTRQARIRKTRAASEEVEVVQPPAKMKRRQQLKVPALERPLSECAHDFHDINVEDIKAYVNRSLEERKREADIAGKIKRELNPFLLYRKAHKSVAEELIRTYSQDTSHINPRISKLCGISWKHLEPPEVKNQYETWSKIEKDRLKEAFPDYRYQPNKRQRGEEPEFPTLTDPYAAPPGSYSSQVRGQRDFTPELATGFGQTSPPPPPACRDETPWLRDCGSPGDALGLDFPTQHLASSAYIEDPFQHEHQRSPLWGLPREAMTMNPHAWALAAHQHDPFKVAEQPPAIHMTTIDPKLYYNGLESLSQYPELVADDADHVPPGQYLLSAPQVVGAGVASSRGPSPEPLGQPWASSIPGNEGAFDYLTGNFDWDLGADSGAPI